MVDSAITAPIPARSLPPRQPLPTPVLYPDKSSIKLGLDVHLEFIMAVVQRDHAAPHAPRKMTSFQLVLQVQKWIPTKAEQHSRETVRRRKFLSEEIRRLANRGHAR